MSETEIEAMKLTLRTHSNALFGDPDSPRENPGVFSEIRCMKITLDEVDRNMKKVIWLILTMFLTTLGALAYKGNVLERPQSLQVTTTTSRGP